MVAVIVTAAGSSRRMGGVKKEYLPLPGSGGLTVLGAAVSAFTSFSEINHILVTYPQGGEEAARAGLPPALLRSGAKPLAGLVPGGETRRASVYEALKRLVPYKPDYVLIHDGARPWVSPALIAAVMDAVARRRAAIPVLPLTETPKALGEDGVITGHLKRASIVTAQTPQGFAFPAILEAHEKAAGEEARGREYTDDAEIWALCWGAVAAVPGESANRKITFPEDLDIPDGNS